MNTSTFFASPRRAALSLAVALGLLVHAPAHSGINAAAAPFNAPGPSEPPPAAAPAPRAAIEETFGQLPLYFIENRGQTDARVSYYLQAADKSIYFGAEGVTFVLTAPSAALASRPPYPARGEAAQQPRTRHALTLEFRGAEAVAPEGLDRSEAIVSYFTGRPADWHRGLATYRGLSYRELWSGIDLDYRGARSELKYTFQIAPGADPGQIQLAYRGADAVSLTDSGGLTLTTPVGSLHDGAPIAWQDIEGERIPVAARFTLRSEGEDHVLGFALGDYDRSHPLTLDPAFVVYAGFIGGTGIDYGTGIAVDSSGSAYVVGYTDSGSVGFSLAVGPDLTYNGGAHDAFVAKVKADGTGLLYLGYIGGSGDDRATGIAVDGGGNAYVVGYTDSAEASFPAAGGPDLTYNGGTSDAFIAKVNAAGNTLIHAGYIGGGGEDTGLGIAVDTSGNAYVTGYTTSTETSFPESGGPDLTYNGGGDAFVAKVKADGTGLTYAGYIGGLGEDRGTGIAVDAAGNAFVTGHTDTAAGGFPASVGPKLAAGGGYDAFVAKVKADGTGLVYAGYIGGSGDDRGTGIAVDSSDNAYVTGYTASVQSSFPIAVGPDLTHNGGNYDAFVAKVRTDGTGLTYAGYIGGLGDDRSTGIAVDGAGNAYVTGNTDSSEASFPVTGGPGLSYDGGTADGFVAKIKADGTGLSYAGYIGGSGYEEARGIAVDGSGNAYTVGWTNSTQSSFPVIVGPDLTHNGSIADAFVAKIAEGVGPSGPAVNLSANGNSAGAVTTANPVTVTYTLSGCQGREMFLVLNAPAMGIPWAFLNAAGQWVPLPVNLAQITPFANGFSNGTYTLFSGNAPSGVYDIYLGCDFAANGFLDISTGGQVNGVYDSLVVTVQ